MGVELAAAAVLMTSNHLDTYLNDHMAGSVVAIHLLQHLETADWAQSVASLAARLRAEIEEDQQELAGLMQRVGSAASSVRQAAGWLTQQMTQLKMRLDDPSDGSLRLLETLEFVALGIDGKRALWELLARVAESLPALRGVDYARLIQRAIEQRRRIEEPRLVGGLLAFGTHPS